MTEQRAKRILVIDDEVTQRILVKEYLEDAGYVVRQSDDGRRGLKMAVTTKPDLIILDLMLPSIDGYTLCTTLKQTPETSKIPIILITASRESDVIERGLAAGAHDFVTKPVDWQFLSDRVAHVLERAQQEAAVARQLEAIQVIEQNSSRQVAWQTQQAQSMLDDRIGTIQSQAAAEIEAIKRATEAELNAKQASWANELRAAREDAGQAIQSLKARSQAELRDAEKQYRQDLEAFRADTNREIQVMRLAAEEEVTALEKSHAEHIARLQAETGELARASNGAAGGNPAAAQAGAPGALRTLSAIAGATSVSHLDLVAALIERTRGAMDQIEGHDTAPSAYEGLRETERMAAELAASIAKLRLFAEVMSGNNVPCETVLDLGSLVATAADRAAAIGEARGQTIHLDIPEQSVMVKADEARLTYALMSLVLNACRHAPEGGNVTLALVTSEDGWISIIVADDGAGMPATQVDRLRNCIDQPDGAMQSHERGAGLGIPISTALVRQHGGDLQIESAEGQGTQVAILLPPDRRHEDAGPPARSNKAMRAS